MATAYSLAAMWLEQGRFADAEAVLRKIIEVAPGDHDRVAFTGRAHAPDLVAAESRGDACQAAL